MRNPSFFVYVYAGILRLMSVAGCSLCPLRLPNPRRYSSKKPSKRTLNRQKSILKNMKNIWKVEFDK